MTLGEGNIWERLLEVQTHDTALDQLRHRRETLPERAALAEVEAKLAALRTERADVESRRHDLGRQQQKLEDEIATVAAKREGFEGRLYAGTGSPKELQALQEEIASLGRRISSLEDDELEIMELIEPVDAEAASVDARQAELDERAVALTAALTEAAVHIDAELVSTQAARDAAAVAVGDDAALTGYETHRAKQGGVAIARLEGGGRCGGCHMQLSAVEKDRIRHLPPDEELRCEDCGRFLVHA